MLRLLLRSLFALVVVAAAVLIGWRVLGPAEVLATVKPPYPTAPVPSALPAIPGVPAMVVTTPVAMTTLRIV